MIILQGKNIKLRPLKKSDAASIMENANNRSVSRFTYLPYPYDINSAALFIKLAKANFKAGKALPFGIEKDKKIIGIIGINNISVTHKKAVVGYWIGKKYWRQGIATEALDLVVVYAFKILKINYLAAELTRYYLKTFFFRSRAAGN